MSGYDKMPRICEVATADIRSHLWSLYWLTRMASKVTSGSQFMPSVVELGVRSGDSTRAILAGCQDSGIKLWSFDIAGDAYHVRQVTENSGIEWVDNLWQCAKSDSAAAAKDWNDASVNMLFVDTDHSLETTRREIAAWHTKIRDGGFIVFHDTGLNEPGRDGVAKSAMEFAAVHRTWTWEDHSHIAEGDCGLGWLTKG